MSDPGDNLRRLTDLYRVMTRIRAFEETALEAHKAGEIPGPLHVSIGQEAVAAGRLRQPADRRPHHLEPSRARPRHRQGRGPQAHDAGALRPAGRLLPRQGRLDAHRGLFRRHARRERRGGGRHSDCGRRRAGTEDAGLRRDRDLHVRRRRDQPRAVPRRAELGGAVQAAGSVRVRGQRRRGVHPRRERHGGPGRDRPRQGARRRGDHGRRQQRDVGRRCSSGRGRCRAARRRPASAARAHLSHHRPHLDRRRRMAARGGSRGGALARSDRAARRGAGRARRRADGARQDDR